jgi:hypothetical protein
MISALSRSKNSPLNCCGSQHTFKARAVPPSLSLGGNQTRPALLKGTMSKGNTYNGEDSSPVLRI